MFAVKVTNLRKGPWGSALAFFDVVFGDKSDKGFIGVFVGKSYVLKEKKAGGYFFQPPSKPRVKDGEPVKDERGYPVYDAHIDLFFEDGKPTRASLKVKDQITEQATALYDTTESGRGSAPARKAAPATAKPKVRAPEPEEELPEEEDDDLPF